MNELLSPYHLNSAAESYSHENMGSRCDYSRRPAFPATAPYNGKQKEDVSCLIVQSQDCSKWLEWSLRQQGHQVRRRRAVSSAFLPIKRKPSHDLLSDQVDSEEERHMQLPQNHSCSCPSCLPTASPEAIVQPCQRLTRQDYVDPSDPTNSRLIHGPTLEQDIIACMRTWFNDSRRGIKSKPVFHIKPAITNKTTTSRRKALPTESQKTLEQGLGSLRLTPSFLGQQERILKQIQKEHGQKRDAKTTNSFGNLHQLSSRKSHKKPYYPTSSICPNQPLSHQAKSLLNVGAQQQRPVTPETASCVWQTDNESRIMTVPQDVDFLQCKLCGDHFQKANEQGLYCPICSTLAKAVYNTQQS